MGRGLGAVEGFRFELVHKCEQLTLKNSRLNIGLHRMHLNEAEIENIEENQPKYFDALSTLNESIVEVKKQFDEVQKQIETTHSNHSDGIPLLRIKVCLP